MIAPDELNAIVERIASGTQTETDIESLRIALTNREQNVLQLGKYNVNIGQGQNVQIGDTVYPELNDEVIQEIAQYLFQKLQVSIQPAISQGVLPHSSEQNQLVAVDSVDALVQKVRSRCCDKIQHLYSKIQLLNRQQIDVDRLYVDVYVLEKLASESYATIPGLLRSSNLRNDFDRLGLGQREKRSPGLEVAAQYPRLMVLGKPGSGKSTFLRYLAVVCCKGEFLADHIPVLLELRFIRDVSQFNLLNIIHREFGLTSQEQTEQILNQGNVLILLDGLDEVPIQLRRDVQDHIVEFSQQHYKNRLILTCRTQTTEYTLPMFDYVEVADFNAEQVEIFAQNWFATLAETPEQGTELKAQFMAKLRSPQNKQTAELAVTPILLSLTCWVFNDLKNLPPKRSDLYEQGLNLLLKKWDEGRGIRRDSGSEIYRNLSVGERKKLLSHVAVCKFEQQQYLLFEQNEIQEYIAQYLRVSTEDAEAVLEAIEAQHGLLIERARGIWSFSHLTFQEYFTAHYMSQDYQQIEKLVAQHLTEEHWQEVFLLIAELMPNGEQLLASIENAAHNCVNTPKFQALLVWASQVTSGSVSNFKPAAQRAAALILPLALPLSSVCDLPFDRTLELHTALAPDRNIAINLASNLASSRARVRATAKALAEARARFHANNPLDYDRNRAFEPKRTFDPNCSLALDLAHNFKTLKIFKNINLTMLIAELKVLEAEVPDEEQPPELRREYAERFNQTWFNAIQLHQEWVDLSEEEAEALSKYLYANKLMVRCKEASLRISQEKWEEIEETLLLPIAEIEK